MTDETTDALDVLGHETRIAILRALADAEEALSFTDLRRAIDVRDPGRFNYHLERLCEYFVRETGEGYELGHAGTRLLTSGELRESSAGDRASPPERCPVCGDRDCERLFHVHLSPPWGAPDRG